MGPGDIEHMLVLPLMYQTGKNDGLSPFALEATAALHSLSITINARSFILNAFCIKKIYKRQMTRCLDTGREGEGEGSQNKIENMQTNSNFLPCAEAHNPREARDRAAQTYDHKLSFDPYSQGAVPFRQR